jgi:5'-3' exonuclease
MDKFVLGLSSNTNFLYKIEFNSPIEYYSYYLGINCMDVDRTIIKKMVLDYIAGIEWCLNYYLDECPNWIIGYNFMVAPLIKDIINIFPTNKINIPIVKRTLNPVEQLILAIPPQTYKYVIEKTIIDQVKSNKNIGYMIPESFDIDVNKEQIFWKCQVKIPIVEYEEFNREIKQLKISNNKNKIYGYKKNF